MYIPPTLVVDAIVFQIIGSKLHVLLIKRSQEPFLNTWALPGGYNPEGETTRQALHRILQAKGGVDEEALPLTEQLYTFDTVARDPRGHAVSVTYMSLGFNISPQASQTTQSPQFFPVDDLPALAYDHIDIITYARKRLISKISYTTAASALLPSVFTLTELQAVFEAAHGHDLDKRNFRKRYLAFNIIKPTGELRKEGAHRPAQLYTFTTGPNEPLDEL